jgi:penicillin-binding protein 2
MTEARQVRIRIVGVVIVAVFSALFARLWFLQVGGSNKVAAALQTNSVRTVHIPAPRGRIFDGKSPANVLADNAVINAITVRRSLVGTERAAVIGRLVVVLNPPGGVAAIQKALDDPRVSPYSSVPVATNVPFEQLAYVKEHQPDFPGVDAVSLMVRRYRTWGNGMPIAPQLVGYIGEINGNELKARKGQGYVLGDIVGKSGVEQSMEGDLHGVPGYDKLEVDNRGRVQRVVEHKDPVPGSDVYLTLDTNLQGIAQESLQQAMEQDRRVQDPALKDKGYFTFKAPAGSFVMLDARNGSVVAMASEPGYDPNEFVKGGGITTPAWKWLNDPAHSYPLTNRAIQGLYAPGSTFKPVTATAMLKAGIRSVNTPYNDMGFLKLPDNVFLNDHGQPYGLVNLPRALTLSSDAYFYSVGLAFWQSYYTRQPIANGLQDTAHAFGFGAPTRVMLADEAKGRIPDAAWKVAFNANNPDAKKKAEFSVWQPGDSILFATGQGDLLVTPVQLASAYMALANNGTRWVPRIVDHVTDYRGNLVRTIEPRENPRADRPPGAHDAIMEGLRGVAGDQKGTAYGAFQGFPLDRVPIAGKTGTAQVKGKEATSVFVAITNPDAPQYVATSFVEEAGYGAAVSAPVVRRVLTAAYQLSIGPPPPVQIDIAANQRGN